jgi:acetoacetate decarboxylase
MGTVRYGARPLEQRRNRELEATKAEIWSQAITCVYETDPDVLAAVLPPPLQPGRDPHVRITITVVDMPGRSKPFGAGYVGVRARHEELEGEYPLFMPMTTEQATIGGRETYGEPKKIGDVWVERNGDGVRGVIAHMGFTIVEIAGRVTDARDPYERTKTDFYFKFLLNPDGTGFDHDPALVHCTKVERARVHEGIDGDLILKDSPLDPIADLPVRRIVDLNWTERATIQTGRINRTVPAEWVLPFAHQRYDDLSVLGTASKG